MRDMLATESDVAQNGHSVASGQRVTGAADLTALGRREGPLETVCVQALQECGCGRVAQKAKQGLTVLIDHQGWGAINPVGARPVAIESQG